MVEKLTPERLLHEFSLGPDAPQVAFTQQLQVNKHLTSLLLLLLLPGHG
jgi:hypothetical protein